METEELGSVYESLLELTPRASADARRFEFAEGDETKGNARKTSGSYYTPDALVKLLRVAVDTVDAMRDNFAKRVLKLLLRRSAGSRGRDARRASTSCARSAAGSGMVGKAWRECGGVGRRGKTAIRKEEAAHPPNSSELATGGRLRQHGS